MATGAALANIAVAGGTQVMGVNSSNQLMFWNGTGFVSMALPFNPSQALNSVAMVGEDAISALDTSGGIHFSMNGGNTWAAIPGTAASITGASPYMFVNSSTGTSYHVNLLVPSLTVNYAGTFVCNPNGRPCEDYGLYVYISATASFAGLGGAHGLNGVTNMVGGGIPQYLNVSATEDGPNCDPFISPDDPSCSPMYADELYTCVEDFYYSGPIPFEWEVAQTSAYWNGTPTPSCNDYGQCTYVTHNNCTAATTPPDMSVPTVTSGYFVGDTYVCWMNTGVCVRPITGGRWYCTPLSFSYLQSINVPLAPYACTHNP